VTASYDIADPSRSIKILLVDDDEIYSVFLGVLVREIKGLQCDLTWVESAEQGLQAIEQANYDVYLIDYQLGQDNGLQLMQDVRAQGWNVPMILLTSTGGHGLYTQAMEVGATGYLVKGEITASLLERSIRHAMNHAQALESLRLSEERYAAAVRSTNDGIWDWDLSTDTVYYSARWKAILGYAEHELTMSPDEWRGRVHHEDLGELKTDFAAHVNGEQPSFSNEHRMMHRDGSYRWVRTQGVLVRNSRVAGSMTDITDRKRFEIELTHSALHDSLTGLPNRRFFLERLEQALRTNQPEVRCAVLFLDLDRFKVVNDSLGHAAGDELLRQFAERLRQVLQHTETVARFGGDEFSILLEGVESTERACRIAEHIEQCLSRPITVRGHNFSLSSSTGIAMSNGRYGATDLLRNADIAMYEAKNTFHKRYAIFDDAMLERVQTRLKLEDELRLAIERREFVLFYQPICSVEPHTVGFEALIRWQHPQRGLLPPGCFITCVEDMGLITEVGWWVLEEACRGIQLLQQASPHLLTVSINLSASQFYEPELLPRVKAALQATKLNPSALKLEITESTLMSSTDSVIAKLNALSALGVTCHIDDFGTGYSSLSYLYRLPSAALKIDRSFVADMSKNQEHSAVVQTIINLAHNLGQYVVAEGVETQQQFTQLKSMGCEYFQGYWFSPPLAVTEAASWLTSFNVQSAEPLIKYGR
jgi:diguanylate cyclase (GGDEF)-like protein/PAS domain S-box-containing protein